MPKLDRWLIASKMVEVIDKETLTQILNAGGQIGGGWCQIHQHVCVNPNNVEIIEKMLLDKGFTVCPANKFETLSSCHHDM